MEIKEAFASALKQARKARGLTQEDFSDVSSRTYISTLERGIKSPTIEKIDALSKALGIHPLTLLTLTYMIDSGVSNQTNLNDIVWKELNQILS
jgi:transcriptional regulator with XRE-family HTH domain